MDDRPRLQIEESRRLEHISALANARLDMAEKLGLPLAFLAGVITRLRWDNFYLDMATFVGVFILVTWPFRGPAKRARDDFFRFAKLGKYARHPV